MINSKLISSDWYLENYRNINWKRHSIVFDWIWSIIWDEDNNLLYNIDWLNENWEKIDSQKRLEEMIKKIQPKLADLLLWIDFKKPAKNLIRITDKEDIECFDDIDQKAIDLWYFDNAFIIDSRNILNNLWIKSLALWWAVADCAWICWNYGNWDIISLSHVWWQWLNNWVIEQLIYTYMAELWKKEFSFVDFDFSPMAWDNYSWDREKFFDTFKDKLQEYDINAIKERIFVPYKNDKNKWFFYLDRFIKRIFLENWANLEQLNFSSDYTTSLDNRWPSYRIHSLWKQWIIESNMTKKWKNNMVPDARMWVFNIVS